MKRNLSGARFGFLGNTYSGMLDMYSDFTMIQGQTGAPGNHYEDIQGGFIVGHSLLTAKGIPCAGEGDLKACLAMKICDILGKGGSFCEIVVTDYEDGTILMGHDGPFHLEITREKPVRFKQEPDLYMEEWFAHAPTHHFAMSVGRNGSLFQKTAKLLGIPAAVVE